MKTLKKWWALSGLENLGLVVAALILWFFFKGSFTNDVALVLGTIFVTLNWVTLRALTTIDEDIEEKIKETIKKLK